MKTVDRAVPARRSSARQAASASLLIGGLTACLVGLVGLAGLPGPAQAQPAAGAAPLASSLAASPASAPTSAPTVTLQPLHWLAGCWHSELDEAGSGEQWMAAAGGTMLGLSRMVKGGRTVQFEFMQIRESALGVVFIAHPSAQAGTRFAAVELSASAAVFEQRGPDFPQRVIYRLLPDGRLAGRIEGLRNGEWRGVDFPMRRGPCDAPVTPVTPLTPVSPAGR